MIEIKLCALISIISILISALTSAVMQTESELIRRHDEALMRADAEWRADLQAQGMIAE